MEIRASFSAGLHARELRNVLGDDSTPLAIRLGCPRAIWDRLQFLNAERRAGRPGAVKTAMPAQRTFANDDERRRHSEQVAAQIKNDAAEAWLHAGPLA